MSACTIGLSPEVRYSVCLMASTCGSRAACSRKPCTLVVERLVRVVDEDVGLADRLEEVGAAVRLRGLERDRGRRHVRRVAQLGAIDLREVEQAAQIERSGEAVDLLRGDVELADEQVERQAVHVVADLEADRRTEPAAQQLGLERLDQVLGLVLLDRDVLVAGEAERVVVEDLHAGEEVLEVVRDELLERQEPHGLAVVGELHEPGEHRRHLEARELLAAGARVADADREVEREPRDVGERVRRVDGERHEHGEDLRVEVVVQLGAVVVVDVGPRHDLDAGLGERGPDERRSRRRRAAAAARAPRPRCRRAPPAGSGRRSSARRGPVMMRRLRPATRTMKNSSRLLAKIARKFARSSTGSAGSSASSSTRWLNASQLSSRSR